LNVGESLGRERKREVSERPLTGMDDEPVPADARAEIAAAVRAALAEHGYARLTTATIAAESDLSEAGLYYHCDSKADMVRVFLDAAADYLAEELAAVEAEDPEARIRAAVDRLFTDREDEAARGVDIAVMELLSHAPHDESLRDPLLAMQRNTYEHLAGVVAAGVEDGTFRDVDPEGTAAFLLAAAHGSTGFYLALGMESAGEALHGQVDAYVDWLVAEGDT
jgi:AcrR family transcriptional regulator